MGTKDALHFPQNCPPDAEPRSAWEWVCGQSQVSYRNTATILPPTPLGKLMVTYHDKVYTLIYWYL